MSKPKPTADELRRKARKRVADRNYRFSKMAPEKQRVTVAKDVIAMLDAKEMKAIRGTYMDLGPRFNDTLRAYRRLQPGIQSGAYLSPEYIKRAQQKLKIEVVIGEQHDVIAKPVDVSTLVEDAIAGDITCHVCGIGSCFVAALRRADKLSTADIGGSLHDDDMRYYLGKWFTPQQLALIECAFEANSKFGRRPGLSLHDAQNAALFGLSLLPEPMERPLLSPSDTKHYWDYINPELDYAFARIRETVKPDAILRGIMANVIENDGTFVP